MFRDFEDIEIAENIIKKALLQIEHTLGEADNSEELSELENKMLDTIRPLCFDSEDPENYQVQAERSFEELCALLASKGIVNPHELPALQFYLNIQILTKKKPQPKWDKDLNQENL